MNNLWWVFILFLVIRYLIKLADEVYLYNKWVERQVAKQDEAWFARHYPAPKAPPTIESKRRELALLEKEIAMQAEKLRDAQRNDGV